MSKCCKQYWIKHFIIDVYWLFQRLNAIDKKFIKTTIFAKENKEYALEESWQNAKTLLNRNITTKN